MGFTEPVAPAITSLVVTPDDELAALLAHELPPNEGFALRRVRTLDEALALVAEDTALDAVLVQTPLPGTEDALVTVTRLGASTEAAVIALPPEDDEALGSLLLAHGVEDWVPQVCSACEAFDGVRLRRSVRKSSVRKRYDAARQLRSILQHAAESVVTIDTDRVIHAFNGGAERLYGRTAAEVIGKPVSILPPPDQIERQQGYITRLLAGETIETYQAKRVRGDGRSVDVELSGCPITDSAGAVIGAALIGRDITDQVNAQEQLATQQRRLEASQSAGHVGTWELDLATMITEWSAENARLHGFPAEPRTLSMEEFVAHVHVDDRAGVWRSVEGSMEFTSEYRVNVDGETRTLVNRGAWQAGPDDHPGYLLGTSHDVTEERAARSAERRAEAQFRRAFADTLTAMAICDIDARFVQVNDALCDLSGIPREKLIGRDARTFAEPRDGVEEPLTADANHVHVEERRYEHPDGHVMWVEVAISAVEVPGDGVVEYFVQVRDITERLEQEQQLRFFAEHDPLTGVLNRRAFDAALQKHLSRTEGQPKRGALLMIDLDNFKHHNDTYGHASGDELLKGITQAVQASLRGGDLVGRLGGDEFVVLLPETTHSEAELVASRLLHEIGAYASLAVPNDTMPVTASIGIVDFLPGDLAGWALVKDADKALYEAKEAGRNRWVHHTI